MYLKDSRSFWKKNGFFIILMNSLVLISVSLFLYTFLKNRSPQQMISNPNTPVQEEENQDAVITMFEGKYNNITQNINFSWSYTSNQSAIESVKLFLENRELLDVTSYSSQSLSREMYGIPTGNNTFTLVITDEEGKQIKKSTNVFVNYVTYIHQDIKTKQNSMEITLTYTYEKKNPVKEPQMLILDEELPFNYLQYNGTTRKEENGIITAKTVYEIFWNEESGSYNTFSVRWSFGDYSENNQDFTIDKTPVSTPKESEND